jgi:signal transduction histidine kinase
VSGVKNSDSLKLAHLRVGVAGRTTLLYLAFGVLWFVGSFFLVDLVVEDPSTVAVLKLANGVAFIVVSAALIYFLIGRHAEKVLRSEVDNAAQLSLIVNQLPAILWTVDSNLVIRSSTGFGLSRIGVSPNRSVGRRADEIVPPHAAKVIEDAVRGTAGSYVMNFGDRVLQSWVEPMREAGGKIIGAVGLSIDITEQETAREELERSTNALAEERNRLRMFLEQLPAILWAVDRDLVVRSTVGAGLRSIDRAPDQAAGRHITELVGPDSPVVAVLKTALDGVPGDVKLEYRGRCFRVHVEPLRDVVGDSIVGALGLAIDVTEEELAQKELAEKTRALEGLSAKLIDAQEAERARIARELHDEFGGIFTSLHFDVSWIREKPSHPELVEERAREMTLRINEAMQRVREVAGELRPKVLDDFGLVPAIEDLVRSFSDQYGIETNLSTRPEEIALGRGLDIILYRIIQEALTNIAKHSEATRVEVRLRREDHQVVAEIRDDGRGIRPEEIASGPSLGLLGMRERTEIIGGDLVIEPYEGKGTIVRVRVPLHDQEEG